MASLLAVTVVLGVVGGLVVSLLGVARPAVASTVTMTYSFGSYTSGATWTVPSGVTSITVDVRGGAGGTGGRDSRSPGVGGLYGRVVAPITVTQGNVIGIFPGGSGGNGSGCFGNAAGGSGGVSSLRSGTRFNGGAGGNAGSTPCSGGGGGGGAASLVRVNNVERVVAAGAGGGAGANNVANAQNGQGGATYPAGSSTITNGVTGGTGTRGDRCGVSDGGGGGGGGGGDWSGQGGGVFRQSNECGGYGGWRGDNRVSSVTPSTNLYTTSVAASTIVITFTLTNPSTPDLTAATDLGLSNTDNITASGTPRFVGTAVGGAQISLGINGSYSVNCGNANATTGAYTCNWSPSSDGTYTITTRATLSGAQTFSSSLSVTIDRVRPTATLTRPAATSTSRTLTYTLGFSESIWGLASGDFSNTGTATGCTFTPSAATGTSFTVGVTCTSDGTVVLRLAAGGVSDTAGNAGPAVALDAGVVTIDSTAPVPGLTPATINNSGSATVRSNETGTAYLVRNTVTVTNLASITGAADNLWNSVSITTANTATSLSAAGLLDGTYVLYTVDLPGNLSAASTETVTIDSTPPSASWTPPSSPVRSWSFSYTLTFTESVSGLTGSDFSYTGTASGCVINPSSSTGTTVTVSVTCTSDGTFTIALAANAVADAATNTGPASILTAAEIEVDAELVVTYDSAGGSAISTRTVMVGDPITASPGTPIRVGFTFSGWSRTAGGDVVTFPYTHASTADFTMFAVWEANSLTVTFNSRGGSSVAGTTVKSDATLAEPTAPTRTGFTFGGWSASLGGSAVSFPYTHGQTTDFTLFAIWTGDTLVVTFTTGDGGSAVSNGSTVSGGTLASPGVTPTRAGFTFDGWSPLASGGSPVTFPYGHGQVTNFTMYAIWRSDLEPNNVWFYPGAGAASVGSLTISPSSAMQPAYPRSTDTYSISGTITTPLQVQELDNVMLCLYKSDGNGSAEPGVSSECENAATDPETEMQIVWSQVTQDFLVTGGSDHANDGSTAEYAVGNVTLPITFSFKISHAARAGDWTASVITTDKFGSQYRADLLVSVNFFAAMITPRASQAFGFIAPGGTVTMNDFPAGEYTANANADFTINVGKFVSSEATGSREIDIAPEPEVGAASSDPSPGHVQFECSLDSVVSNPVALRRATPKRFEANVPPTAERQRVTRNMSCRLTYGGGAPRALVEYSASVTFGVGAEPATVDVTFDSRGGSEVESTTVGANETLAAPTPPTRDGFTFAGWSRTPSGPAVSFPYTHGSRSRFTLYAIWTSNGS